MARFTKGQRIKRLKETDGRCGYCSKVLDEIYELDHVIPKSCGGVDSKINILPSCRPCNATKRDKGLSYLKDKLGVQSFWFEKIKLVRGAVHVLDSEFYGVRILKTVIVDPYDWEKSQ